MRRSRRDVGLVQFTLRSGSATMIDTTKSNTTKRHDLGPRGRVHYGRSYPNDPPVGRKSLSLVETLDIKRLARLVHGSDLMLPCSARYGAAPPSRGGRDECLARGRPRTLRTPR
jgi:hypothetical protein